MRDELQIRNEGEEGRGEVRDRENIEKQQSGSEPGEFEDLGDMGNDEDRKMEWANDGDVPWFISSHIRPDAIKIPLEFSLIVCSDGEWRGMDRQDIKEGVNCANGSQQAGEFP